MTQCDQDADRIRQLALAIGLTVLSVAEPQAYEEKSLDWYEQWGGVLVEDERRGSYIFNPFTDANDDYEVLQWVLKTKSSKQMQRFAQYITDLHIRKGTSAPFAELMRIITCSYQIGDYAKAAVWCFCPTETHDGD